MKNNSVTGSEERLEQRLSEACDALWDQFVDPSEAYVDDGVWWNMVSTEGHAGRSPSVPFASVEQLAEIRQQNRRLAATNAFAINGIENRISYIVGVGHHYRPPCARKPDSDVPRPRYS